jgi:hypothetical protein
MTFKELQQFDRQKKWKKEKRERKKKKALKPPRFSPADAYNKHILSEIRVKKLSTADSTRRCAPAFSFGERTVCRRGPVDTPPHYDPSIADNQVFDTAPSFSLGGRLQV